MDMQRSLARGQSGSGILLETAAFSRIIGLAPRRPMVLEMRSLVHRDEAVVGNAVRVDACPAANRNHAIRDVFQGSQHTSTRQAFLQAGRALQAAAASSVAAKSVRGTAPTPGDVAPASR